MVKRLLWLGRRRWWLTYLCFLSWPSSLCLWDLWIEQVVIVFVCVYRRDCSVSLPIMRLVTSRMFGVIHKVTKSKVNEFSIRWILQSEVWKRFNQIKSFSDFTWSASQKKRGLCPRPCWHRSFFLNISSFCIRFFRVYFILTTTLLMIYHVVAFFIF